MPKITVIMPSLNVVNFIKPCIESVLDQTFQDMEILVIDAGSTDGTLEILNQYALKDRRVKVIGSEQKSYGYQLNLGISMAKGEYIGVVETDDIITSDMFETLYYKAAETGADYVKGTAQAFFESGENIRATSRILTVSDARDMGKIICPKECPNLFVTDRFLWLGIYKTEFLREVKLNETRGAAFQDIGFAFQVLGKADKAVYLDKDIYFYRQDNTGASSHSTKAFQYLATEYTYIKQFLVGKSFGWYQAYYHNLLNQCMGCFQKMAITGEFWTDALQEINIIREWLGEAVRSGFLTRELLGEKRWGETQQFLESAEKTYNETVLYYRDKKNGLEALLKRIKDREVIIFGSGQYGKFIHALLESKCPGRVKAYCDNNQALWKKNIQSIVVLKPEEAVKQYIEAIYIIANRRNEEEMRDQLKMLGVAEKDIYLCAISMDLLLFR